ncbi:xanthine dehydrogenase molybdopterin binding subunit [Luteolibacter sp. GHJ8]|uniref:Xanthine dehydrogenase molybdopterin binding subunit n=1 Tax=Luteolibacter rhizosphaerae TaxID=2989719 RepID=A0ABT3FZ02_9BACT|nr:xanthine dehydrogenase molybdopterin binding subunit [Luteolibacter rhizosphaerae]MCW1912838.1 xanthine dehydrogenase molybdopterin binding subunit [Luteolibacter rhizosphaerae]
MSGNREILRVNGKAFDVGGVALHETVLDFLRRQGLTGTKCGCNEGDCGACSVLLVESDGKLRAVNSCLALVQAFAGREVRTVEGIGKGDELHPVQAAMVKCQGSQCGYCTPGFIASMTEAWHRKETPDDAAIADQLCGNLCRCTGYRPIREAMTKALAKRETREEWEAWMQAGEVAEAPVSSTVGSGIFLRPSRVADALAFMKQYPGAVFLAGATEIAVLMNKRHLRPEALISLDGVRELAVIRRYQDAWEIGGAARMTDIQEALAGEYPALDEMFRWFASRQIRHRATLGGNLATASPIGDSAPILMALDASVILVSAEGEREVLLDEFFVSYRKTVLRADELIRAIRIPRKQEGRVAFYKVSKRREMDISIVAAGIRVAVDEAGLVSEARLAFGGVAEKTVRAKAVEAALIGKPLALTAEIEGLLEKAFTPLSDVRSGAGYRVSLVKGLFEKFVANEATERVKLHEAFEGGSGMAHESAKGHVTGSAKYVHDTALGRTMLEVWAVRSKVARGILKSLDVTEARGMPGIHAVLVAEDLPGANNSGPSRHDEPLLAEHEVLFHGQALALVVGDSLEQCRLAAEKVVVEIEELKPILGIEAALAADSFHTDPHVLARGDVKTGLGAAARMIEGTFAFGGQEHFYLETQAAWAEADGEGGMYVASSTQHPSEIQTIVAEALHVPRHKVVVESPRMGGGFGGKETQGNAIAALCAVAALKTGRPVRWQLDRDEDMATTGKRHPFLAKYRVGYDDAGMLQAAEVKLWSDGGWSLDLSLPVTDRALFHLDNAYYIPNVHFEGRVAKTNVTSHTAFRGFGGPQGMLVIEEIIGRIALRLGLPPEEVRRKNFYHGSGETNTTHYGAEIGDNRVCRIWDELLESSEFERRRAAIEAWNEAHPKRKRGMAITPVKFGISFTLTYYNQAGALLLAYADGSVQVNHGGTEMGQGLHTKILGVVMRELGLPAEQIRLMQTRTDKVPNTSATAASSGSDLNGMAVADACRQIRERLSPLAAEKLGCAEDEIRFADGSVHGGGNSMAFGDLTMLAYQRRVQLAAAGFYATPDLKWDWNVGKGKPFHYYACGAAVSEVEIDGFTGMSTVKRVDILHDVGDSLNAAVDRGQIEGGFVQGMGWLTREELKWSEKGVLLSHSASTYAIPAISDAPEDLRVSLLKRATQDRTIHGSKAVGEPPFMLAISVREAIRDAVRAFGGEGDFDLGSPATGEAVKGAADQVTVRTKYSE